MVERVDAPGTTSEEGQSSEVRSSLNSDERYERAEAILKKNQELRVNRKAAKDAKEKLKKEFKSVSAMRQSEKSV